MDAKPIRIFAVTESSVYHLTRECPTLHRRNAYHRPEETTVAALASRLPHGQRVRMCKVCRRRTVEHSTEGEG